MSDDSTKHPEVPPWLPQQWQVHLPAAELERAYCLRTLTKLAQEISAPLPLLRNYIDDSRYDVQQWLMAIATFSQWMEEQGRSSPIAHQLNYLHCATWAPEADLGWPMVELLHEMLSTYGYDGPEKDQNDCQP